MKKCLKLLGILLLSLLVVTACGSNDSKSSKNDSKSTEGKEKVELTISAASSLQDALDEVKKAYEKEHSEVTLTFNYGASGSLQQQISQGAPVDLFFSAAEDKFDTLVDEGKIAKKDRVDLLGNELVLVVPKDSSTVKSFDDLANKNVEKIALGTPETVPAGQYGKESLENMDLWKDIKDKVVYGKDVRQVLSYVETGNVEAGLVYKTDALTSDKVEIAAAADSSTHTPIIYPVGVIKDSEHYDAAKEFYNYLQDDNTLKVFEKYGFTIEQ